MNTHREREGTAAVDDCRCCCCCEQKIPFPQLLKHSAGGYMRLLLRCVEKGNPNSINSHPPTAWTARTCTVQREICVVEKQRQHLLWPSIGRGFRFVCFFTRAKGRERGEEMECHFLKKEETPSGYYGDKCLTR